MSAALEMKIISVMQYAFRLRGFLKTLSAQGAFEFFCGTIYKRKFYFIRVGYSIQAWKACAQCLPS
jgi:hypothetical protein